MRVYPIARVSGSGAGNKLTYLYRSKSVRAGRVEGVCQSIQSKCTELSAQAQLGFGVRVAGVSACRALLSCSAFAAAWRPVALEFFLISFGSRLDKNDLESIVTRKVSD
jgi:hypothetical protein